MNQQQESPLPADGLKAQKDAYLRKLISAEVDAHVSEHVARPRVFIPWLAVCVCVAVACSVSGFCLGWWSNKAQRDSHVMTAAELKQKVTEGADGWAYFSERNARELILAHPGSGAMLKVDEDTGAVAAYADRAQSLVLEDLARSVLSDENFHASAFFNDPTSHPVVVNGCWVAYYDTGGRSYLHLMPTAR